MINFNKIHFHGLVFLSLLNQLDFSGAKEERSSVITCYSETAECSPKAIRLNKKLEDKNNLFSFHFH